MSASFLTRRPGMRRGAALAATAALAAGLTVPLAAAASAAPATPAAPHCPGRQIDSYRTPGVGPVAGRDMGIVRLFYNGSGNCAYFQRGSFDHGTRLHIEFDLVVGDRSARDAGDYLAYAGPLSLPGRGKCVTLSVREHDANGHMLVNWRVGPTHCGR